jgi:hypothetical protein
VMVNVHEPLAGVEVSVKAVKALLAAAKVP